MAAHAPSSGSVDVLRHLKEVEDGCDARLAAARSHAESALNELKTSVEETVRAARLEADKKREAVVREARSVAEREADAILAAGKKAADGLVKLTPKALESKREAILTAVLGGFRAKGGSK